MDGWIGFGPNNTTDPRKRGIDHARAHVGPILRDSGGLSHQALRSVLFCSDLFIQVVESHDQILHGVQCECGYRTVQFLLSLIGFRNVFRALNNFEYVPYIYESSSISDNL